MKTTMVSFRGAREKHHRIGGMPGGLAKDMVKGPLWRETLGRSLGSHNAADRVSGMCHGNGCRQETT